MSALDTKTSSTPKIAIVFPGQGSQKPGMGRDFFEASAQAREVFEEASDAVGFDLGPLCFDDDERLGLTEFQQPAILTVEIAMLRALHASYGLTANVLGGHSLGEYTALAAAGVIPLAQAVKLVHQRGRLMQTAVPAGSGAMVAVVHKDVSTDRLEELSAGLDVDVANENAPGQIVLSGRGSDVQEATARIAASEDLGRARALPLRVSAPFHSRLMTPMVEEFRALLEESSTVWDTGAAPKVVSNRTGGFHEASRETIVTRLAEQITGTVRWIANMAALAEQASTIYEVGPGRPLRSFFKSSGVTITSISTLDAGASAFRSGEGPTAPA